MKNNIHFFILFISGFFMLYLISGCAFKTVKRSKNIVYNSESSKNTDRQKLNVFSPSGNNNLKPVLIFVHGGAWNSGNKSLYNFFGNRMARKGVVTVIPDYPKSPKANYQEMAMDIAMAVQWVKNNISSLGGDSNRIFISGHSAGGHLAALITIRENYFKNLGMVNPIKGLILIDAAGLDMYGYLKEENFEEGNTYLKTFTNDPATWKEASPLYFLKDNMPPMLIYRGGKTYPSILKSNEKFVDSLKKLDTKFTYHIQPDKKHIPMILQFFNSNNKRYREIGEMLKN